MADILSLLTNQSSSESSRVLDELFNKLYKFKAVDVAADWGIKKLTGSKDIDDLQKEMLMLQIAQKRQSMGLPMNDDDFERLINDAGNDTALDAFAKGGTAHGVEALGRQTSKGPAKIGKQITQGSVLDFLMPSKKGLDYGRIFRGRGPGVSSAVSKFFSIR